MEAPANDGDGEGKGENDGEDDDGGENDGVEAEPGATQGGEGRGKRKKRDAHGRRPLDTSNLQVIEDRVVPDEVKAAGGKGYRLIGEEVSERIARRPAEWVRFRLVRLKYAAMEALTGSTASADLVDASDAGAAVASMIEPASDGGTRIVIAPLPAGLWPNTMGDASAISHVIISKYGDLLPLNRQQGIAARGGFMLPKSTQCAVG